jgi:hypothetical protein
MCEVRVATLRSGLDLGCVRLPSYSDLDSTALLQPTHNSPSNNIYDLLSQFTSKLLLVKDLTKHVGLSSNAFDTYS